jgi:acetyl/propionyl-CoA carboxylase alpha subunit
MPGRVTVIKVKAGDTVSRGATLMVLEAMKMEHAATGVLRGRRRRRAMISKEPSARAFGSV